MKTNLIAGIAIVIVAVLIVTVLLMSQPAKVVKQTEVGAPEISALDICPNGVSRTQLIMAENMVKDASLLWFENLLNETNKLITKQENNLSTNTDYFSNISRLRSAKTLLSIEKNMVEQLNFFYDLTERGQSDSCETLPNGTLSNMLGFVELIVGDVASMVSLNEELSNKSSCFYNESLESCLTGRWIEAGSVLKTPRQQISPENMPDYCINPLSDPEATSIMEDYLNNFANKNLRTDLNEALLNAYQKEWDILEKQYNEASQLGDDEDSLITKIVVSENIIQFDKYYQGLKSKGCA